MQIIMAALVALLLAGAADAVSCTDGKTAENITPSTIEWAPSVSTEYANASGIWQSTEEDPNSLVVSGSIPACVYWGGYEGGLTIQLDSRTFYECDSEAVEDGHWDGEQPCYPYHVGQSGIAPENSGGTTLERVQIKNHGDGVSLELSSGDVVVRESWLDHIHDDGIEDDFCAVRDITVQDNLIERTNMLFAWDLRSGQTPCSTEERGTWYIDRNIGELYRFAHTYKERPGHGGVFKDADELDWNPALGSYTDNIIKMGPVLGSGQDVFPNPDWLTGACEGNVYLWIGTEATAPVVPSELEECITVVSKLDTETVTQFKAKALDELGGYSWNQIRDGWVATYFTPDPPGCGIGPELALVLPLLGAARRRRAPARPAS